MAGTVASQALAMAASIISARLLGRDGFGEFGIVVGTVGTFGWLAGMGLGVTTTKHVAQYRSADPGRAGRMLALSGRVAVISGLVVVAVLLALAPQLAARTLNAPHLTLALQMGGALLYLNALNGVQQGALSGLEAFRAIARTNLIRGLVNCPLMVVLVWMYRLEGAVAATVATAGVGWWVNYRAVRGECSRAGVPLNVKPDRRDLPVLWHFALPALISGALLGPVIWLANTLLARQPGGYGQVGLVNASSQWRNLLLFLPTVVNQVTLPPLASALEEEGEGTLSDRILEMAHGINQIVLWPIAAVLVFMAGPIMGAYGKDFTQGRCVFALMVGGTAIAYVGNAISTMITSRGLMWFAMAQNLSWAVVLLSVCLGFARSHGALAVGVGMAAGYVVLLAWSVVYAQRRRYLPTTMARRVALSGGLMVLLTLAGALLPGWLTPWLAVPLAALMVLVSFRWLVAPGLRSACRQRLAAVWTRKG